MDKVKHNNSSYTTQTKLASSVLATRERGKKKEILSIQAQRELKVCFCAAVTPAINPASCKSTFSRWTDATGGRPPVAGITEVMI